MHYPLPSGSDEGVVADPAADVVVHPTVATSAVTVAQPDEDRLPYAVSSSDDVTPSSVIAQGAGASEDSDVRVSAADGAADMACDLTNAAYPYGDSLAFLQDYTALNINVKEVFNTTAKELVQDQLVFLDPVQPVDVPDDKVAKANDDLEMPVHVRIFKFLCRWFRVLYPILSPGDADVAAGDADVPAIDDVEMGIFLRQLQMSNGLL